jgi:hypothetical protein
MQEGMRDNYGAHTGTNGSANTSIYTGNKRSIFHGRAKPTLTLTLEMEEPSSMEDLGPTLASTPTMEDLSSI